MKRIFSILMVVLLIAISARAQPQAPDTLWTHTYGGTNSDEGYSVQQTSDGGFIITGKTNSYGAGNADVYLIKTDSLGNQLWYQTFGGTGTDCGQSVQQTTDGGYIIAGYTNSFGAGGDDVYLIKTDTAGNQQWYRTFGGAGSEEGHYVLQTSDGGYIIVGEISQVPNADVYLIKTDTEGNQQWTRTFGDELDNYGYCIQQTIDGGYIITGETECWMPANTDVLLIKTDASGYQQWYRTYSGAGFEVGNCVQQTNDNGYIITGSSNTFSSPSSFDVFLMKTDNLGIIQWFRTYGGNRTDDGYSVQLTNDGGYIIAGETFAYTAVGYEALILKTDSLGNQQWLRTFGGNYSDYGRCVQLTSEGGYIVVGYTSSFGAGGYDVYLIRLIMENEQISIDLNPINPPIIIPAGGGSFQFTMVINNLDSMPVFFDAWTNVSVPLGYDPITVLYRPNLSLSVGGSFTRTLTQNVLASYPAGTYTYRGFVGEYPNYVIDCDSFTFVKLETGRGFNKNQDWAIEGWDSEPFAGTQAIIPDKTALLSAYPNPFNSKTNIKFELPNSGEVSLVVYDIEGKEVCRLIDGWKNAGVYEVEFKGEGLSSGVYLIALDTGILKETKKVALVK